MAIDKKYIDQILKVSEKAALDVILENFSINFISIAIKFFDQAIHLD